MVSICSKFADDIFKCTILNDKFNIFIQISLRYPPLAPKGGKPLLESMMFYLTEFILDELNNSTYVVIRMCF